MREIDVLLHQGHVGFQIVVQVEGGTGWVLDEDVGHGELG